jgi:hypothetical protein
MLMNYHEMTMDEGRDSPARRKQFLIICTVMLGAFIHSLLTAGGISTVNIQEGIFPGGDLVYKFTSRDYAATGSLMESIGKDAGIKAKDFADTMYTVYLDEPTSVAGRQQRFACGYLATDTDGKKVKKVLLEKNDEKTPPTEQDIYELPARNLWPALLYESQSLPSVKAAVVQFPFTNGFVSALVHSYKIIPALRKHVLANSPSSDHSNPPVIITTCSAKEQMCTHYAPLVKSKKFLLGRPDSVAWIESLPKDTSVIDWKGVKRMANRIVPFAKYLPVPNFLKSDDKEEL